MKPTATTLVSIWISRFVGRVAQSAPVVLLAATILTGLAASYSAKHLGIDTDTVDMFSPELPFRRNFDEYKRQFPQRVDTLVVVIDAVTPDLARRSAELLAKRLSAADDVFRTVYLPEGGEFLDQHGLLYLDLDELEQLAGHLARAQPFLGRLTSDPTSRGLLGMLDDVVEASDQEQPLDLTPILDRIDRATRATLAGRYDPLSWQGVLGGDDADAPLTRRRVIITQPRLDYGLMLPGQQAMRAIRAMASDLGIDAEHGVNVRITGQIAMATEELKSVSRSAGIAAVLATVLVGVVLLVALRSVWFVLASLLTLFMGLVITAGFAAAAVGHLNMISISLAALYVGLGIDYSIHLCLRYQELARSGCSKIAALRDTAADIGPSLALCTASTAIGFYAFVPTSFEGISELGLIAGTGMLISLGVSMTVLPALLAILPQPRPRQRRIAQKSQVNRTMDFVLRNRTGVRWAAIALGAGGLLVVTQVRFDDNPLDLRDPTSESISTFKDLLATSDTPPWSLSVLASGADGAQQIAEQLRGLNDVAKVVTAESFIPSDQEAKLAVIDEIALTLGPLLPDQPQVRPPSPDEQIAAIGGFAGDLESTGDDDGVRSALAHDLFTLLNTATGSSAERRLQLLDLFERNVLSTLESNLGWLRTSLSASGFTLDDLPEDLRSRWISPDGTWRVEVFPREDLSETTTLRDFVTSVRGVAPGATGAPVVFVESGETVVRAFRQALTLAVLAISVLLLALMRNIRDTLLVLVPLALAGVLTVAAAVLINTPFNFANVIALPLLLGVGVDSGIHIVHGARSTTAPGTSLVRSSTARAVLYSAMTTLSGFGALMFWAHRGTASLGRLLTLGIILTLLCTLIVLPALIHRERTERSGDDGPVPG